MKSQSIISSFVLFSALTSSLAAQGGFVLFGESSVEIDPAERFVRPLTGPYFHEDAFVTTDLRAWYLVHEFDGATEAVLDKGEVSVVALQVRLALTESLQVVAYKDGYTEFDDAGALNGNNGWNDIGAGLKWAFIQDWEHNLHLAAGIGYEFGWGDDEVLQDTDELRLWLSANKGIGRLHLGAMGNVILAENDELGSDMITVHLHADYRLNDWFSPVLEMNGYLAQDSGGFQISGVDAVSLPGGEENDTWTIAVGGEFRPVGESLGLRFAYEDELNDNASLFGHRWTLSAVYAF